MCEPFARYWVPHPDHGFSNGTFMKKNGAKNEFKLADDGELYEVPEKECAGIAMVTDEQLMGISNIVNLTSISEGGLLETVKARYQKDEIYTNVARIVLATNPFKSLPIYTPEFVDKYKGGHGDGPHVYGIGSDAFQGLMQNRKPQAVLISGESGAGKTESTKHVLSYLADVAGNSDLAIENKILSANPILEAFGNAKTVRNNNSSRFGKWIQLIFLKKMEIEGAQITDYLLELTRIVNQGKLERNYHVFYQLLSANSAFKKLGLKTPGDYEYLKHSQFTAPGIKDDIEYTETYEAFKNVGFSQEQFENYMNITCGILSMGNAVFKPDKGGEGSEISNPDDLKDAAKMLGVDGSYDLLASCLTTKKLTIGKDVTTKLINATQAASARDSIGKLIYLAIFKDIILFMNTALVSSAETKVRDDNYVGVLDIAGFESFDYNSLEQLFINLSNETLQQYFNSYVFKSELDDYKAEEIPIDDIKYKDNLDILELIQGKGGILDILDEELNVAKATYETYASKVNKEFGEKQKHTRFVKNKFSKPCFVIKHFAGDVEYQCEGWLDKNLDDPPKETVDLMKASTNPALKKVGEDMEKKAAEAASAGGARGKAKKPTVSKQFRASLKKLIDEVQNCDPHFIRCIKPNSAKVPKQWEGKSVMEQLLNSGAMEAVKIRQAGYPFRLGFEDFTKTFFCIIPMKMRATIYQDVTGKAPGSGDTTIAKMAPVLSTRPAMTKFVTFLPKLIGGDKVKQNEFAVGKSKIFMKINAQTQLQYQRNIALQGFVVIVQKFYRGFAARKSMRATKKYMKIIKAFLQEVDGVYAVFFDAREGNQKMNAKNTEEKKKSNPGESGIAKIAKGDMGKLKEKLAWMQETGRESHKLKLMPPATHTLDEIASKVVLELELLEYVEQGKHLKTEEVTDLNKYLGTIETLCMSDAKGKEVQATLSDRKNKITSQKPILTAMLTLNLATCDRTDCEKILEEVAKLGDAYATDDSLWYKPGAAERVKAIKARKQKCAEEEAAAKKKEEEALAAAANESEKAALLAKQKEEEEKAKKVADTKRKQSITGVDQKDSALILSKMEQAIMCYDFDTLRTTVDQASRAACPYEGTYKSGDNLMKELHNGSFVEKCLREVLTELETAKTELQSAVDSGGDPSDAQMKRGMAQNKLMNLVKQAKKVGVSADIINEAQQALASSATTGFQGDKGTSNLAIFNWTDPTAPLDQAQTVALQTFGDLYNLNQLRERKPVLDTDGRDLFLEHSKHKLKAPLFKNVPVKHVGTVLQCFRNVLGWMNDRPVQDAKRVVLAFTIVAVAKAEFDIRNEVYLQTMKQLRNNPNLRSEILGWKLLLLLAQQAAPAADFKDYVETFFWKGYEDNKNGTERLEISHIAKECGKALAANIENLDMREREALEYGDTSGADRGKNKDKPISTVKIEVFLMDNSTRKLRCKKHTTIAELGTKMTELLRLGPQAALGFGFFQLVDDVIETHRIIPDNVALGDLGDKWNQLFKKNGKQSRLLWKRQYLLKTETIPIGDTEFANLTFRQAYFEYLRYPIWHSLSNSKTTELFYEIACSLISLESTLFAPYLSSPDKLVGCLERLLPTVWFVMNAKKHGPIKNADRSPLVKEIEGIVLTNCKATLTTKQRKSELKDCYLVVPPLVSDPAHVNCQMVHDGNWKTYEQLENPPAEKRDPAALEAAKASGSKAGLSATSALLATANLAILEQNITAKHQSPFVLGDYSNIPTRLEWAKAILNKYNKDYKEKDDQSKLAKLTHCMSKIQSLQYYGNYFYSVKEIGVKQLKKPDAGTDVPLRTVDPKSNGEQDYWICIDLEGIRLLTKRKEEVELAQAFLYFTGATNCCTKWGAKDNVILLQLRQTPDHYCSLFVCKMALDIAYCMFRLSKTKTGPGAG